MTLQLLLVTLPLSHTTSSCSDPSPKLSTVTFVRQPISHQQCEIQRPGVNSL